MHSTRKIKDDLIYVGGSDRRLSRFENLFPIPRGVSYNSYVLLDEKTVLFDTADDSIGRLFCENVTYALDGRALDYLVVQHMEPDHCSLIDEMRAAIRRRKSSAARRRCPCWRSSTAWMRKTARWSLPRGTSFPPASIRCISSWRPWSTGRR